eukprot:TRINITY_DN5876_c0_g1_i3.p3 TRINITY_DN5876_c0_g1~~TRINITY_DN5876_c0_g1_i3.p3  ORF type:complete len:206 (-),score=24.18 TRINITY_DN5876_c0_g1_i3:405-989(-)
MLDDDDIYGRQFQRNWTSRELDWPNQKHYCTKRDENWWCQEDVAAGSILAQEQSNEKYEYCFRGHCNNTTIKKVAFAGPDDCWLLSGSDDGRFFVWDRKSGRLMEHFRADNYIVNCIACAPDRPVFASCGIDQTVKVWRPIGGCRPFQRPPQWYANVVANEFSQYQIDVRRSSLAQIKHGRKLIQARLNKEFEI